MRRRIFRLVGITLLVVLSSNLWAVTFSAEEMREIKKRLKSAGVDTVQENLLIRRMEVRNVPASLAREWADDIDKSRRQGLPVPVVVDRLQQGLIKNIRVELISKSLKSLRDDLAWGNELLGEKVIKKSGEKVQDLDEAERSMLSTTIANLEIASRQGHARRDFEFMLANDRVDLEMAEKLTELTTVWTNYGLENKKVIASLERTLKVGLSVSEIAKIGSKVDSAVAVKQVSRPYDIIKFIWQEIRNSVEKNDAEFSYRSGMQVNPNNAAAYDGGGLDAIGISSGSSTAAGAVSVSGAGSTSGTTTSVTTTSGTTTSSGTTSSGTTTSGTTTSGTTTSGTTSGGGMGGGTMGGGSMGGGGMGGM